MYRLAILASRTKNATKPLTTTTKRKFGGGPVDEHPYFTPDNSPLYTKYAYTRHAPNSTYGEKFPHPMNYQGHVPVTPTSFARLESLEEPMLVEKRVARNPTLYVVDSLLLIGIIGYFSARIADRINATNEFTALPPQQPVPYIKDFIQRRVQQSNQDVLTESNLEGVKNVYQTEEFNAKLQLYLQERANVVDQ